MAKNEQRWPMYISDEDLLKYIGIFEGMLERWSAKHNSTYGEGYRQSLVDRLEQLNQVYEERTS